MSREIIQIIDLICREKGIDRDVLISAVEEGVVSAARRMMDTKEEIEAHLDLETGNVEIFSVKLVVKKVENKLLEITLKDAQKLNPDAELGDELEFRKVVGGLGRIAAQVAKQVITQRVREAERDIIYNTYKDRQYELFSGIVIRDEKNHMIVDLGRVEAILPRSEMSPRDNFHRNDRIRAILLEARRFSHTLGMPELVLSRTHPSLIERLFEMEIPEIKDKTIEIVNVVREPGKRAKVCVKSKDSNIDPVGACVGQRGARVQSIVRELNGENIDIIPWTEDVATLVSYALNPAKIQSVEVFVQEKKVKVIVADDQLSLAIGKKGQNVRLAVRLTGWDIDIKSESVILQEDDQQFIKEKNAIWLFQRLPGIGEKVAEFLVQNNLYTYEDIAKTDIDFLMNLPGIGLKKAEAIIEAAQAFIDSEKTEEK
ncbi:transcription termination/antitermination protein NusA [bacterium]|nr:transcription termination/antitermination protein NusA [bacterium]